MKINLLLPLSLMTLFIIIMVIVFIVLVVFGTHKSDEDMLESEHTHYNIANGS